MAQKVQGDLSQFIGHYATDSSSEEDTDNIENDREIMNSQVNDLIGEISSSTVPSRVTSTDWTKCYVKKTGHPYYWNTSTRDVTWNLPEEYEKYLKYIEQSGKLVNADHQKYWSECFSDENSEPYYVNKITRVVSWIKPSEGFTTTTMTTTTINKHKRNKNIDKKDNNKKTRKTKQIKKNNRTSGDDMDEKIELISSYTEKTDSSSDEENTRKPKHLFDNVKSIRSLLVPQYDDDFDSDSEKNLHHNDENKQKQLFPFLSTNESSKTVFKLQKNEPIYTQKIYSLKTDMNNEISCDKPEQEIEIQTLPITSNSSSIISIDLETENNDINKTNLNVGTKIEKLEDEKTNNLIEDVPDFDVKTFQRKRRIEFLPKSNVIPNVVEKSENTDTDSKTENIKKNLYSGFKKGTVEFGTSNETDETKTENPTIDCFQQLHISEIQESGDLIKSKLKFLSEGSSKVTSVQAMYIQYETLILAYESKNLTENYLLKWIRDTTENLSELEKEAVPDGWRCEWERKNSRYCYLNLENGKKQLDFPSQDIVHNVNDEMDISTTPPPNILEDGELDSNDLEVTEQPLTPPPPIISVPDETENLQPKKDILGFELESFYSDIAGLEENSTTTVPVEICKLNEVEVKSPTLKREGDQETIKKKTKKIKVQGISSKMKDISGMVAKWQQVQRDLNK